MSLDLAKEICMLQRNEKEKLARQYFIRLEKDWNSPEKVMARALQIADKRIHALKEKVKTDKPKILFTNSVNKLRPKWPANLKISVNVCSGHSFCD